jgi:phage tail sheath protein FI
MPATYIAPGVYTEEIDLSLYVPQLSTSILGLVGGFQKGPLDQITFIANRTQFEQIFGTPLRGEVGFAAHAALYFLRWASQLKVVRVSGHTVPDVPDATKSVAPIFRDDSSGIQIGQARGVTEGDWADGIQVVFTTEDVPSEEDPAIPETLYNVFIYDIGTGITDSFGNVNFSGVAPLEFFEDVVFDDTDATNYVEKIVNGNSLYITLNMTEESNPDITMTYLLAGGDDGTSTIQSSDIIGGVDATTGINTGLRAFEDPLIEDINLISAPGFNHVREVATEMITLAQTRFDVLAVLDTPDLSRAQDIRDYVRGSLGTPGNPWSGFAPLSSSNRAAIYSPWVKIFDSYNNEEVFVPPSVRVLGVFAFNDNVAFPWFAAAGPNRGVLFNTLDVRFKLSLGGIELIYGFGTNVNPIQVTVDGILVNGNKTLQRKPSLLQNVHIVRMLMYAEKVIATATRFLQWEPHDPITWRRYTNLVEPFLQDIVAKRGITEFRVKCDKETNTDLYINQGQMVAELHIIPTNAVAVIVNRFIIHPHGASLESSSISPTQQTIP